MSRYPRASGFERASAFRAGREGFRRFPSRGARRGGYADPTPVSSFAALGLTGSGSRRYALTPASGAGYRASEDVLPEELLPEELWMEERS